MDIVMPLSDYSEKISIPSQMALYGFVLVALFVESVTFPRPWAI